MKLMCTDTHLKNSSLTAAEKLVEGRKKEGLESCAAIQGEKGSM
jgi:hypothetical protein